ncbi:hypothetical protein GGI20_002253 [Coemansia sp. BCRC 34301]|nr:hypothetical protein GGI20_002253 [Coemansia sp. BCRC 34301]
MSASSPFLEPAWELEVGTWMRAACVGLCLMSLYFGAKTLARYRRYFDDDNPAIELPTMFLLPWLGICDILNAVASLVLLLLRSSGGAADSHVGIVRRAALASQICYSLLHIVLSVHTMSVAGVLDPTFDRFMGGYYGAVAGALSFVATHRVMTAIPLYSEFHYTVLPLTMLTLVSAAAVLVPRAARAKDNNSATVFIGENEDVEAIVSLDSYSMFVKVVAALCLLWHLPWLVWSHAPELARCAPTLVFVPLCARGVHSFALLLISPAMGVQVVDKNEGEHAHQD